MKLLNEIIELASDGSRPLADVLRKCLILAFELKNERLKEWVDKELNGFANNDEFPKYRKVNLHSKGTFSGYGGAERRNVPLPMMVMEPEDWDWLTTKLRQPIVAYEKLSKGGLSDNAKINWPPDLIHKYQSLFMEGWALAAAWQEVPQSLILGLCEEVRNRLLRFALEIKSEMEEGDDTLAGLAKEEVEKAVTNIIYGGVNVFGGTIGSVTQIGTITINAGDFEALSNALLGLEVPRQEIVELKSAILADGASYGSRTKEWLVKAASIVGKGGAKMGAAVGTDILKELLLQYFDMK